MSVGIVKVNSRKQINYHCLDDLVESYHDFAVFCCDNFESNPVNDDGSIEGFYLPSKEDIEEYLTGAKSEKTKNLYKAALAFGAKNGFETYYHVSW